MTTPPIIDKPGFYTSKAGKCEVLAVRGDRAFGIVDNGSRAMSWYCVDGSMSMLEERYREWHITGPWVEPRKPVEGYVSDLPGEAIRAFYTDKETAEHDHPAHRIIHLREVDEQ